MVAMGIGKMDSVKMIVHNSCCRYLVCRPADWVSVSGASQGKCLVDYKIAVVELRKGLDFHLSTPSGGASQLFGVRQVLRVCSFSIAHISLNVDEIDEIIFISDQMVHTRISNLQMQRLNSKHALRHRSEQARSILRYR